MNIWIINHYATLPNQAGGTRHFDLAKFLVKQGHTVSLVLANFKHSTRSYIADAYSKTRDVETIEGVKLIWIETPSYHQNGAARLFNMLAFSWRLKLGKHLPTDKLPDLIMGSSPHLFAAFSAKLLAKRMKVPFILELRDLWPETLVDLGKMSANHPLIRVMAWMEQYLYKNSQHIVTLLPMAAPYLTSKGVDPAKISWLPNGVDFQSMSVPAMPTTCNERLEFIYAGTHGLANGLNLVIDAVALLTDKGLTGQFIVKLIGDGPEKSKLMAKVEQLNLSHSIVFLDPVAKSEVFQHIAHADVALMLLKDSPVFRWGISPNKLFDYMAMARPVIFGVSTPFNPIAQCNAGLVIAPEEPEELARAMQQFMSMSAHERQAMGARGREYVLKEHDIQAIAAKLQHILKDVVHEKSF